jgi:hypothetical protein
LQCHRENDTPRSGSDPRLVEPGDASDPLKAMPERG